MNSKKLIAGVVALAMAAAIVPSAGQAATAEELAAQIAQLQTQLASLMGQLGDTTGTVSSTAPAACAGISFTRNLTLGSQGADVQCLQSILNQDPTTQVAATGVGSIGSETQYFGGLTKTAVVAFQNKYATEVLAPVGLTAGTGFVGASTRAKLNAMLVSTTGTTGTTGETGTTGTTGTTLPEGCTSTTGYSPTTGEPCSAGTTSTGTGLTMTGQEGAITVSINPTPANGVKLYEGDEKVAVYGIKVKATGSDVDVQRATLKFNTQPYSYFTNVYLYDGDTQVASSALNSSTVSKVSASDYQITLAGFTSKVIVPVNEYKVLTVKVDVLPGISSSLLTSTGTTVLVGTPSATAVRAVDQAGLNQYGGVAYVSGGSTTYRTFTVNQSQSANATVTVSLNGNTPKARNIIADSSNEIIGATLGTFDVKATKDGLLLDSMNNVAFGYGITNSEGTALTAATGTFTISAAGAVTGSSTLLTTEFAVGDKITCEDSAGNLETRTLTAIASATAATTNAWTAAVTAGSTCYVGEMYTNPTTVDLVDDAGTVIGTASPSAGAASTTTAAGNTRSYAGRYVASFTDLNYTISKDTTKTFSIKIDDTLGAADATTHVGTDDQKRYVVSIYGDEISTTKTNGASLTGTATTATTGYPASVFAEGPVFTIASISTSSSQAAYSTASSTITATFNVQVAATTGDVYIPSASAFILRYGLSGTDTGAITNITYICPSGTISGTNTCKVSQGTTATFAVTGTKAANAGTYDVRINGIKWAHTDVAATDSTVMGSTYMAGDSAWISNAVYLQ